MRTLRSVVALVALAMFPVVVLALLAGLLALTIWGLTSGHVVFTKFAGVAVVGLVLAGWRGIRDARGLRAEPMEGAELTREQQPDFWRAIDEIASVVGTEGPARIVVTGDVNAAVTQASGQRELIVGLPLLGALTAPELRAVLAHEFGHYGAGHTRLTALTWRSRSALDAVSQRAEGIAGGLLGLYSRLYDGVAGAASRDQEWVADEYAARVAGPAAAAAALRRTAETDLAWDLLCDRYLPLAGPAERRAPIVTGLRELMRATADELRTATDSSLDESARGVWGSSHPPMRERIRVLTAQAQREGDVVPPDAPPASSLLTGGDAAFAAIEQELTHDTDDPADWREVVGLAGARVALHDAGQLTRAAREAGQSDTSLGALLDAVEQGRGPALVEDLVNPALAPERKADACRTILADHLGQAIVAELTARGRARHEVSWSGPHTLVDATTGATLELDEELRAVVAEPSRVPAFRERLAALGVEPGFTAASVEAPEPVLLGVATHMAPAKHKKVEVDVLVCDSGVLILPLWSVSSEGLPSAKQDREAGRLQRQLDGGISQLRQRPGAQWIDTDDIVSGCGRRKGLKFQILLTLRNGAVVDLRARDDFDTHGPFAESLGQLLGARWTR